MELNYTIAEADNYITVKQVLKEVFEISDRLLLKLKNSKLIYLNGAPVYVNHLVATYDNITVKINFEEDNSNIVPTKMDLAIIYEDDYYLVLNKPANISIHPSMAHFSNSLSNGVRYYFDMIGLKKKIRPVNRLDKDTSGIVIFAKNEYIQECLVRQMKLGTFVKQYICICDGYLTGTNEVINAPISRKENSIIERCISSGGDTAITYYSVLKNIKYSNFYLSELLCTLGTGRTHQIRVHMSHLSFPILGDTLYGSASSLINRQALHSYKSSFMHPISKKKVEYIANLPDDILKILKSAAIV